MIFVVDDEDAALVVAGSEFRFEQSAGALQGHVALACQDAQRQIGTMLQLLHALLQLHSLEYFPAAAGDILLHALGQDLDDIASGSWPAHQDQVSAPRRGRCA